MTNVTLAQSYLKKAQSRLKALRTLFEDEAYSDVVREAQELVELAQKAMLRQIGVEPPKQHDVGKLLLEYRELFSKEVSENLEELAQVSRWLRKERDLAFYGDIDFIPTSEYGQEEALRALKGAEITVAAAENTVPPAEQAKP